MAHPTYKPLSGRGRYPSVTTILSRFKESGGLIHWAWDLGMQGMDYRQVRDDAASAGHLAHDLIENRILGADDIDLAKYPQHCIEQAYKGFEGYLQWAEQSKLSVVATEVSLCCDELKFGGTLDAVGICNDQLVLLDWKTSNRIYHDYILQVGAYRYLWENGRVNHSMESGDIKYLGEKIQGLHLVRFGKQFGDFHHHAWPLEVLDQGESVFKQMRAVYDADKALKKLVG